MVIDYSKFDNIEVSSSSGSSQQEEDQGQEEGEEEVNRNNNNNNNNNGNNYMVPVYKLSGPGDKYTTSGGATITVASTSTTNDKDSRSSHQTGGSYSGDTLEAMAENGSICKQFVWAQTKYETNVEVESQI